MKNLIIVCDDKTKKYANYLRQLISTNDDTEMKVVGTKDGDVEAIVWSEKQFEDNCPKITSSQHVLYVGQNKTSNTESTSMIDIFHKYGMKYGWLGKRGIITVDAIDFNKKEYDDFLEFCKNYGKEYEKQEFKLLNINKKTAVDSKKDNKKNENQFLTAVGIIGAEIIFGTLATIGIVGTKIANIQAKIKDQQWRALITIFYLEGLNNFLEN